MEKKKRAHRKGTRRRLPDAYSVPRLLELFRVLRLRLFYFILIFSVGLREAEDVVEEELVGSLEDSMSCHLNLPWGDPLLCSLLPVVAGPHGRDFTVPPGVSPQKRTGALWQSVLHTQGHSLHPLGPYGQGWPGVILNSMALLTNTRPQSHCDTPLHTQQPQQRHLACQTPITHPSRTQVRTGRFPHKKPISPDPVRRGGLSYALIRCFLCNLFIKCLCNLCEKK